MTKVMPPKLAAALIGVAREVKQLGKSERNKFANYDFVSVDKFYAVVGGLMAEGGVLCIPDCIESEVLPGHVKYDKDGTERRGAPLLRERWAFTLIHESGETYEHPVHRTVTVPAEGAQAHGSSESYAQKQFLRGVFRVPTGDKDDADYQAPQTHAEKPKRDMSPHPEPEHTLDWGDILQAPSEGVTEKNPSQSRPVYTKLREGMRGCDGPADLARYVAQNKDEIWGMGSTARHYLREAYDTTLDNLMTKG
jgi:hypothetical protein